MPGLLRTRPRQRIGDARELDQRQQAERRPLGRHRTPLHPGRCRGPAWVRPRRAYARAPRRRAPLAPPPHRAVRSGARRDDRRPGRPDGQGRPPVDLRPRLAADVSGVPTIIVCRTDALSATLLTSDVDEADAPFITGDRTPEGFFRVRDGLEPVIARSLAYAPYCDLIWFETSTPDLGEAREFAQAIHERYPGKMFAYNCSPSFNWRKHLDDAEIASFRETLAELGYRYQFVTLAGFHSLNAGMFELARGYAAEGMP